MDRAAVEFMALLALLVGFGLVTFVGVRMLASRGVHIEDESAVFDKGAVEKIGSGN